MRRRYRLLIDIGDSDRRELAAGAQSLVIAKQTGNGDPNVAWLAWVPAARNVITWDDSFGLYASELPASHGSVPQILDFVYPARDGAAYPFAGAQFASPHDRARIPHAHYAVSNAAPFTATFGLVQSALLNGRLVCAALNAVALPPGLTADFSPGAKLYVWTEGVLESGAVVSGVPARATVIDFDRASTAAHYRYDRRKRLVLRSSATSDKGG